MFCPGAIFLSSPLSRIIHQYRGNLSYKKMGNKLGFHYLATRRVLFIVFLPDYDFPTCVGFQEIVRPRDAPGDSV